MKLFIDDERNPIEDGWTVVRNGHEALWMVRDNHDIITAISFDNDLGGILEGDDILKSMIGGVYIDGIDMPALQEITVHSANSVKSRVMINRIEDAIRDGRLHDIVVNYRPATLYNYPVDNTVVRK